MAFSFTQIEKDKSSTIGFVFFFLIIFYFVTALLFYWACKAYFLVEMLRHNVMEHVSFALSWKEISTTLIIALVIGSFHWLISTMGIIKKMLSILRAEPLNPKDRYHATFKNILDEISVATGGEVFEGVVISTSAMNAFALADFNGQYVIGVTEGLLSRLNRAQLEAVVAHEAGHILKGDCLETTITTSLFDLYKDMLSSMGEGINVTRRTDFVFFLVFGYGVLYATLAVSQLFKMFISREREFRADAIAVRLTRDPLSLAEALYMISHRWRGFGVPGDGMEAIFIVSPEYYDLDEEEGLFPDLFSTHPPLAKRLEILLDMAHSNMAHLEEDYNKKIKIQEQAPDPAPMQLPIQPILKAEVDGKSAQWEVFNTGQWKGPYSIAQLMTSGWVEYDAFVRKVGENQIVRLCDATEIKQFNSQGLVSLAGTVCPICQINLNEDTYKGAPILRCSHCAGILLYENDVQKILSRDDYFFSDHVRALGDSLFQQQNALQIKPIDLKTANFLVCPRCHNSNTKMLRNFYTVAYPVEIDRCLECQSIWFDRSELEILQYMIGKNQIKKS